MNQQQKKYVLTRLQELFVQKTRETRYTAKKVMTRAQMHFAVSQGSATLKPLKSVHQYNNSIEGWFNFPLQKEYDAAYTQEIKARDARKDFVTKEYNRIRDEINLDDAKDAFALIASFAKL